MGRSFGFTEILFWGAISEALDGCAGFWVVCGWQGLDDLDGLEFLGWSEGLRRWFGGVGRGGIEGGIECC